MNAHTHSTIRAGFSAFVTIGAAVLISVEVALVQSNDVFTGNILLDANDRPFALRLIQPPVRVSE